MAIETPGGGGQNRRPSFSKAMVHVVHRGQEVAKRWPKKQKKKLHPATRERNEFFRQVQWAFKFADPRIQQIYTEAVAGTPLLPRDLFLSAMSGRMLAFYTPEGHLIVSVPAQNDVSQTLDFLESRVGAILIRGKDGWIGVAPGTPGQVLTMLDGAEQLPGWAEGGGGGGPSTLVPLPEPGNLSAGSFFNITTTTYLFLMAAFCPAPVTIEKIVWPFGGTNNATVWTPCIYDWCPIGALPASVAGAQLLAKGPQQTGLNSGTNEFPFDEPVFLDGGRVYLIGIQKHNASSNTSLRATLVNREVWTYATALTEPPAVLPVLTRTANTGASFWTE